MNNKINYDEKAKLKKYSSSESVVILSDQDESHEKCKREHCNQKTNIDNNIFKEKSSTHQNNINISQQIQVDNHKFQCVINLNTNIYEHESRCKENHKEKLHTSRSRHSGERKKDKKCSDVLHTSYSLIHSEERKPSKEHGPDKHTSIDSILNHRARMLPQCNRKVCWNHQERKRESFRRNEVNNKVARNNKKHERNKTSLSKNNRKHKEHKKCKHRHKNKDLNQNYKINYSHEIKQTESRILLSPISSIPLDDNDEYSVTYEDISSIPLDLSALVEKPMTHKRRRKHTKYCSHRQHKRGRVDPESKLDTLIKRTKERERKLVEESRSWYTSTPIHSDYSSADFPMTCSDMDISINSLSTLFLGTNNYSPSIPVEDLHRSFETEKLNDEAYSPSYPTKHEDYDPSKGTNEVFNIKTESTMKVGTHSPTQIPELESAPQAYFLTETVKKEPEIKIEPLFSSGLSPIPFENDNNGLQFCKLENVKTESKFT